MAIDTLAYVKEWEAAGVDRATAEAHVVALAKHALPDVATKGDLALMRAELQTDVAKLSNEITWRMIGITALMNGILFALLRLVH